MGLIHQSLDIGILMHSPVSWLVTGAIVFLAGYVRVVIGFGSGLIMVGLLTFMFPIKLTVPVVLLLDIVGSILLGGYDFKAIKFKELPWIVTGSVVGIGFGSWLLLVTPAQHLTLFLGIFLLAYVLYTLWVKPQGLPCIKRSWGALLGLFSGIIGSLYGGGGPPIVAYLQMRKLKKHDFRATFQAIALIDNIIRIGFYLFLSLLTMPLFGAFVLLVPAMILGLFFGNKMHFKISEKAFMNATLILLAIIAVKYIAR